MTGKEKCRFLKEIRRQISKANEIEDITRDCTYQGSCKGTCPACEAEVRYLENKLALRKKLGKTIVLAGISASMMLSLAACKEKDKEPDVIEQLEGDVLDGMVERLEGEAADES